MLDVEDLTYKINGCAMRIHNQLGYGFPEVIYHRCLDIELNNSGLVYAREVTQNVFYNNIYVGARRADFIVEGAVVVELKAIATLENVHIVQVKNYLNAYNLQVGLLINFGSTSLQFKKIFNTKKD